MSSQSLDHFPLPNNLSQRWPWHQENHTNDVYLDEWPRISIVTPSYNQADYLEETVRSVLLQGYPNLEYIIMDGGSTDGSLEIIKKYQPWLTSWTSKPDKGQADAIRSGFNISTGSLLGWLNSDDIFFPNSLFHIAKTHQEHPKAIVLGTVQNFRKGNGIKVISEIHQEALTLRNLILPGRSKYAWHQPGTFFPKNAYLMVGGLDPTLHYGMDHDLMCRLLIANIQMIYIDQPVAGFRVHETSKTSAENTKLAVENYQVRMRYWGHLSENQWSLVLRMKLHFILRSFKLMLKGKLKDASITMEYGTWKSIND